MSYYINVYEWIKEAAREILKLHSYSTINILILNFNVLYITQVM